MSVFGILKKCVRYAVLLGCGIAGFSVGYATLDQSEDAPKFPAAYTFALLDLAQADVVPGLYHPFCNFAASRLWDQEAQGNLSYYQLYDPAIIEDDGHEHDSSTSRGFSEEEEEIISDAESDEMSDEDFSGEEEEGSDSPRAAPVLSQEYHVFKLRRDRVADNRSENLINHFLGDEAGPSRRPAAEVEPEFVAGMIVFPVLDQDSQAVACLSGRWLSLVNQDAIVQNFGLRAAITTGIFCEPEDQENVELAVVKEMTFEDKRLNTPMRSHNKARRTFYTVDQFDLQAGDSSLKGLRFKPQHDWGPALIEASDTFQLRLKALPDEIEETLFRCAQEIFRGFHTPTGAYQPLRKYIDIPVQEELAQELTDKVCQGWREKEYYKDFYPHWTYWFRAQGATNQNVIFKYKTKEYLQRHKEINQEQMVELEFPCKKINQKQMVELEFPLGWTKNISFLRLVQSNPIAHAKKYYWFERGEWFHLSESRTDAMRSELSYNRVAYRDLLLPPYDRNAIKKNVEKDSSSYYPELAYNRMAVTAMQAALEGGKSSYALLMDRVNVLLRDAQGKPQGKFEFADLVLKHQGFYHFIHVKRHPADHLDYVCTQAERCAHYLASHLERTNLEKAFMKAEIDAYVERALKKSKPPARKCKKNADLGLWLEHQITEAEVLTVDFLWCNVTEPNGSSVLKDFFCSPAFKVGHWNKKRQRFIDVLKHLQGYKDYNQVFIKTVFLAARRGIRQAGFMTEDVSFPNAKRKQVKIVIALVDDGDQAFSIEGDTNRTLRLHKTRQALMGKNLGFAWVTIPLIEDCPAATLDAHYYRPQDVENVLYCGHESLGREFYTRKRLDLPGAVKPKAIRYYLKKSSGQASSSTSRGEKKKQVALRTAVLAPAPCPENAPRFKTQKSYFAQAAAKLLNTHELPLKILFPYHTKNTRKTVAWSIFEWYFGRKEVRLRVIDPAGQFRDKKTRRVSDKLDQVAKGSYAAAPLKKALSLRKIYGNVPDRPEPIIVTHEALFALDSPSALNSGPIVAQYLMQPKDFGNPRDSLRGLVTHVSAIRKKHAVYLQENGYQFHQFKAEPGPQSYQAGPSTSQSASSLSQPHPSLTGVFLTSPPVFDSN